MKKWQIILFSLISLADLAMIVLDMPRYVTKPLILLSLIVFVFMQLGDKWWDHLLLLIALFFAFLGDVFLLGNGDQFFMLGLGSFLIMQLTYCYIFFKQKMIGIHQRKWAVLFLIIILIFFLTQFVPQTGDLKIPVSIYTISIVLMAILAILRWKVNGYWWVVIGALLFMISDGVLGVNRFATSIPYGGLIVMATYSAAQGCIVHGLLSQVNK